MRRAIGNRLVCLACLYIFCSAQCLAAHAMPALAGACVGDGAKLGSLTQPARETRAAEWLDEYTAGGTHLPPQYAAWRESVAARAPPATPWL